MSNVHLQSKLINFDDYINVLSWGKDDPNNSDYGRITNTAQVVFPTKVISATVGLQSFNTGYHEDIIGIVGEPYEVIQALEVSVTNILCEGKSVNFEASLELNERNQLRTQMIDIKNTYIQATIIAQCE